MAERDTAQDLAITLISQAHSLLSAAMDMQELRQDVAREYKGQLPADWYRIHTVFQDVSGLLRSMREAAKATAEEEA